MGTKFLSVHAGMQYKIPESDKTVKFQNGNAEVSDSQSVSYLENHPDFGTKLFKVENSKPSLTVSVDICPECGYVAKTDEAMERHMRAKHPELLDDKKGTEGDE